MEWTGHLFGLHSNDLTTSSVTQLLHETTDSEESGQKSDEKSDQKSDQKSGQKNTNQPSNKFTF